MKRNDACGKEQAFHFIHVHLSAADGTRTSVRGEEHKWKNEIVYICLPIFFFFCVKLLMIMFHVYMLLLMVPLCVVYDECMCVVVYIRYVLRVDRDNTLFNDLSIHQSGRQQQQQQRPAINNAMQLHTGTGLRVDPSPPRAVCFYLALSLLL